VLERVDNVYFERKPGSDYLDLLVVEDIEMESCYTRFTAKGRVWLPVWGFWLVVRDLLQELIEGDERRYGRLRPVLDALNEVIPDENENS